ncbi:MAG: hypothetical protein LBF34_03320 [Puniceicoccales bacterium]|jgi:hypothetical protein|nr:hypothetical protein [Puniceicoccales bacterium]
MDTGKITRIVVGSIFMVGNCTASTKKVTSLDVVAFQEIIEMAVSKGQQPLMQKITELEQQQKVILENLRAQPQSENPKKQISNPFTSIHEVRKYVEQINTGAVERKDVKGRIDATVDHILQTKGKIFVPSNVLEIEWRKAKVLEMLHELVKSFPRTRIASYCEKEIKEKCLNNFDDSGKNFEYMKLLLLSQCNTWNEKNGKYELSPRAQHSTVREAIEALEEMVDEEGEEAPNVAAGKFLSEIKEREEFANFFSN